MVIKFKSLEKYIIYIAFFFQLILVSYTFPARDIFSSTPLFYVDNGFHWYYLKLLNNISRLGVLTGYDPYFNAGTPGGIASDVSGHAAQLLSLIFQGVMSEIQVWKIYVFFVALVGPILPGIALKILNYNAYHVVVGIVIGIFFWWTSWFHWFHVVGMVSYVFSSFLSLFIIALYLCYRKDTTVYNAVFISILVGLLIFIHPLAIMPVVIFLICFLIFNYQELQIRFIMFMLTSIVVGIVFNLWWLLTFFSPNYGAGALNFISYQSEVNLANIGLEIIGLWNNHSHGSKVYSLLFLLSAIAIFRTSPAVRRTYVWPFILAWFFLEFYAWLAGVIPVLARLTQPNRFAPTGYLFLIFPSVLALQPLGCGLKDILSPKRILMNSSYLVVAMLTVININELAREVSYGAHGHYAAAPPHVKGIGPYSSFVLDTLANETDSSARVLFETSLGRIHDGGHLAGYYAYSSNREFIGGPYPYSFFAGFWDGFVFGVPIEKIPPQKFVDYLKLYNIGWILVHSDDSKAFLNKIPSIIPGSSFHELQFYTVNEKHGFFIKGSGSVKERKHNYIELSDLVGDVVELKYHYFDGLKGNMDVKIEPVYEMDDPTPFIKIVNPPRDMVINLRP